MSARRRFGEFELDPVSRTLQRRGRRVALQDKPMEALLLLTTRAGGLVSREELRRALWPEQRFLEFEHGLDAVLNKLRRALGESAASPCLIETVRGRGYRFAGALEGPVAPERTLVVVRLPRDLSGDPSHAHLAEGLMEELATALGGLRPERLGVISGREAVPPAARCVVEGSVRVVGDRARISVRLTDPLAGATTWAESFEGPPSEGLSLQRRAAEAVCRHVGSALLSDSRAAAVDPQACAAFLRARFELARRTRSGLTRALAALADALVLDPAYARAHAALAEARVLAVEYGLSSEREGFPAAAESARTALRLDASLCEPHAVLGFVKHRFEWDWEGAEREYQRALALDPRLATAHQWLGELLSQTGRFAEALAEAHLASQLDPLSSIARSVAAWVELHARRFADALATCREVIERDPDFPVARFVAARALLAQGRTAEAVVEAEAAAALSGESPYAVAGLAVALARDGRSDRARALLTRLAETGSDGPPTSAYLMAKIEAALGRDDAALTRLEDARETRTSWLADLAVDPELDALRGQPRFAALLAELRLPLVGV